MPQKTQEKEVERPPQHQDEQPGMEYKMQPRPAADDKSVRGSGKLEGKVALITGGARGQGGAAPDFIYAALYTLRKWKGGKLAKFYEGGKQLAYSSSVASLFQA